MIAHSPLGRGKPVSVCLLKELPVGSSDDLASEMPSFGFNHVGDWVIMDQSFIVFLLVHSVPALKLTKGCFLPNHWACSLPDACVQVLVNMWEGRKWTLCAVGTGPCHTPSRILRYPQGHENGKQVRVTANNDLPAGSLFLLTRQTGRDAIAPTNSQSLFSALTL